MDEALLVRERERPRDLVAERERGLDGDRATRVDERLQVLAVDVLEDDELLTVLLAAIDHRDDVRVRQPGDRARLAAEPLDVLAVVRVLRVQHLQRDLAVKQRVVRAVHAGHAAGADELLELEAASDEIAYDHSGEFARSRRAVNGGGRGESLRPALRVSADAVCRYFFGVSTMTFAKPAESIDASVTTAPVAGVLTPPSE